MLDIQSLMVLSIIVQNMVTEITYTAEIILVVYYSVCGHNT